MMALLLISVTILQRFGINLGSYSLNAALPAMYLVLVVWALRGQLMVSLPRLVAFALCAVIALSSALINEDRSAATSLALLGAMYLPFVFVLTPDSGTGVEEVHRTFLQIALFCAIAGIVQFYAQFVFHASWLFDFTDRVPAALRGPSGYNTVIPIGSFFKSNGFFFREPSGFSFMMALALTVEWFSRRRVAYVITFGLALLLTYSGTGLLALLIAMLLPPDRKTLLRLGAVAAAGAVLFFLLDGALNLSLTFGRLGEFGSERSSGYIRYIAPMRLIAETAAIDPSTFWLGHGPGAISRAETVYEFHDPTWAKLIYEYGVLGFAAFISLFVVALRGSVTPVRVRVMLFAAWLIMGGHLLCPEQNFLTLALVGLLPATTRAPAVDEPALQPSAAAPTLGVARRALRGWRALARSGRAT